MKSPPRWAAAVLLALSVRPLGAQEPSPETVPPSEIARPAETTQTEGTQPAAEERLLVRDRRPLWQALEAERESLPGRARTAWQTHAASLLDFLRERWERILLHFSLFVGLFILLRHLRRRSASWALAEEELAATARVLRRPFSAALLLTLLLTPWIHPRAPLVVMELVLLALLVPLPRLLPAVVYTHVRAPLYGLVTLYVLSQLRNLTLQHPLLERLLLLLVTALGVAGVAWFLRPRGPARRVDRGPWWRAALALLPLALAALAVSLVSNVLGWVRLANLLSGATLKSGYLAVVLFASTLVLSGAVKGTLRGRRARSLKSVQDFGELIERRLISLIRLAAGSAWVLLTLAWLELLSPFWNGLKAAAGKSLAIGSLAISIGDVLAFAVVLWIAVQLSRLTRFVLDEDVLPRMNLARGVPGAVSLLTNYLILALGILAALAAAGIEMTRLALVAGALSVGIGFGLQNVVNNFVSGLILLFERPIQVGDLVEIGPLLGNVRHIGIRASIVRTPQGAEVIVPNGNLISNQLINWTLSDRLRRIEVPVGVAYGTDARRLLDVLLSVARQHPSVLAEPEPVALLRGFGDSSLECALLCWTSDVDNYIRLTSEVTVAVYEAIRQAGIEIPFPQRDLHLRSVSDSAATALNSVVSRTVSE
jgi:small-conductance mechanosensitive channel